jgi:hypothetical protein
LYVSANVKVDGTTVDWNANVDLDAANVDFNSTRFYVTGTNTTFNAAEINVTGSTINATANLNINASLAQIGNSTAAVTISGTSANIDSTTLTLEGTDVNVAVTTVTSTANIASTANATSFVANTLTLGDASTNMDVNANSIAIDAGTNTVITANDLIIQTNSTIQAISLQGNSTATNTAINGDDLNITANVFVSSANVTIGNNAADLLHVDANTDFNQWVVVDSYVEIGNTTVGESNTLNSRVRSATNEKIAFANGDSFIVTDDDLSWTGNTTLHVGNSTVYVAANNSGDLVATGNTILHVDLNVNGNTALGNNSADSLTVTGNASFGDSVSVDDQLTVAANTQVANSTVNFFKVDTTNRRLGVNTDTPGHLVHAVGNSTHHTVLVEGTANVSLVANAQSTLTGSANLVIKAAASQHIKLHANGQTAAAKTVIHAANGNFGIGNTTPTHKLRVGGDVSVNTDLTVQQNTDLKANTTLGTTIANHEVTFNSTVVTSILPKGASKDLGASANTWHDVYSYGNTVQRSTADENNTAEVVTSAARTGKVITAGSLVYESNTSIQSAKVIVSGKHSNTSVTENQITEVLMVNDGTDVFLTTYGQITTDDDNTGEDLFTLSANVDSGAMRLYVANTAGYANVHATGLSQGFKV